MDGKKEKERRGAPRQLENLFSPREALPRGPHFFLALFLLLWSVLTYGRFVDPLFLPSPGRVFQAGVDLFLELEFTTDILNSVYRVMMGFIIAAIIGVPIGLIMG